MERKKQIPQLFVENKAILIHSSALSLSAKALAFRFVVGATSNSL
jgi:hypothetical protein